jgi:hypothetical protein
VFVRPTARKFLGGPLLWPNRIIIIQVSYMQRRQTPTAILIFCFRCVVFLYCSGLYAQEKCGVEVKILLLPAEIEAAKVALNVKKETAGHVYFFDTDGLDLLSEGAIVRLRRGPNNDLTVKLRPPNGKETPISSEGRDGFKCEADLTGGNANSSYSVGTIYGLNQLPRSGADISRALSSGQKKLLNDAQISIDWTRVKRIAGITASTWQTQPQPRLGKLTLELWEWPGGKVLELSTKVSPDGGPLAYTELQELLRTKHLSMSPTQLPKTSIALRAIAHTEAQ